MLDEKKIEEAAGRYCDVTDCNKTEAMLVEEGFKEGAHWAIQEFLKGLWHDASEEPKKRVKLLGIDEYGNVSDYIWNDIYYSWNAFAKFYKLKKYCYIDDLLEQKGGEENG